MFDSLRCSQVLSIAPTGSASLQFSDPVISYGIEPSIGLYYWKRERTAGKWNWYFVVPNFVRQYLKLHSISLPFEGESILDNSGEIGEKSKKIIAEESLQNKKNILIVDDDAKILGLLKDLFKEFYNISTASNGMDALRQIHRKKPALIVLDVMLPRLSGFEVLKRIKMNKDTENIPVIMLTAKDSGEHKLLGISLEADEYIPKPFDISYVEKVVKKWLKNP